MAYKSASGQAVAVQATNRINWRIYYDDDNTFSNEDGNPEDAPPWGVIDIIQFNPVKQKKYHQSGADFYIYRKNYWVGVDIIGLTDYLAHEKTGIVKFGRTIPTDKFLAIRQKADNDPDI